MEELVPIGSRLYFLFLACLVVGRVLDFLSTWVATPNLVLEANPIARRLGWRWGAALNGVVCVGFAQWPLPALVITTTSLLVAARNFQSAWLMRSLGEESYRRWMAERIAESRRGLFLFCLFAQALPFAALGAVLLAFSGQQLVPFGVGGGLIAYAAAVVLFTLLSRWRLRRAPTATPCASCIVPVKTSS